MIKTVKKTPWDIRVKINKDGILLITNNRYENTDYYLSKDKKGIDLCLGEIKKLLNIKINGGINGNINK